MEGVRTQPHVVQSHVIRNASPAISVSIQYSPAIGSAVCGHYGSYTSTTIKDKNPLFNALDNKADQLRRSGYDGLRGVIVCDDGAQILNAVPNWATYTIPEVIRDFFRQNRSVAFVITIAIKWRHFNSSSGRPFEYGPKLFVRDAPPTPQ
jgi:hypothetical protein